MVQTLVPGTKGVNSLRIDLDKGRRIISKCNLLSKRDRHWNSVRYQIPITNEKIHCIAKYLCIVVYQIWNTCIYKLTLWQPGCLHAKEVCFLLAKLSKLTVVNSTKVGTCIVRNTDILSYLEIFTDANIHSQPLASPHSWSSSLLESITEFYRTFSLNFHNMLWICRD